MGINKIRGLLKSDIAQAVLLLFGFVSLGLNSLAFLSNNSIPAQFIACIGAIVGIYLIVSSAINLLLGPPQE